MQRAGAAVLVLVCLGAVQGGARHRRDLVYENMVMRNKYNSTTRDELRKTMVGGGILERKVIAAKNGTENRHEESREMECCTMVRVTGASNGGAMDTVAECHPYAMGLYKKIGVCGGRSIYQHANNTDIFMYYGCGRWFIGLEIGVCGGWLFARSFSICVHGAHDVPWQMTSERGLVEDPSVRVSQTCDQQYAPRPVGAESLFRPFHDYIDRTQYRPGQGPGRPTTPPPYRDQSAAIGQGLGQASYDQLELLY